MTTTTETTDTPRRWVPTAQVVAENLMAAARDAANQLNVLSYLRLDDLGGELDNRGLMSLLGGICNDLSEAADYAEETLVAIEAEAAKPEPAAPTGPKFEVPEKYRLAVLTLAGDLVQGLMADVRAAQASAAAEPQAVTAEDAQS